MPALLMSTSSRPYDSATEDTADAMEAEDVTSSWRVEIVPLMLGRARSSVAADSIFERERPVMMMWYLLDEVVRTFVIAYPIPEFAPV